MKSKQIQEFKKTEIGRIPVEWEVNKIENFLLPEKGSIRPIIRPPIRAPGKDPKPPITAAANALIPRRPVIGSTEPFAENSIPAIPAKIPAITQVKDCTLLTGIPT